MHLGPAAGQRRVAAPRQPAQVLVPQPRRGDDEVTFHLKRTQPSFIVLLAAGWSVVYPCHVPPAQMRTHPVGTGPFKFVEFKPNEVIRLRRNPGYWKPGRPFLDGIDYTIVTNRSTAIFAFTAGKFDMTFPAQVT